MSGIVRINVLLEVEHEGFTSPEAAARAAVAGLNEDGPELVSTPEQYAAMVRDSAELQAWVDV
jgi:hypothetical protein